MRAGTVSGRRFLYGRKIHLAHLLQAIGMDAIEVGTPTMGDAISTQQGNRLCLVGLTKMLTATVINSSPGGQTRSVPIPPQWLDLSQK